LNYFGLRDAIKKMSMFLKTNNIIPKFDRFNRTSSKSRAMMKSTFPVMTIDPKINFYIRNQNSLVRFSCDSSLIINVPIRVQFSATCKHTSGTQRPRQFQWSLLKTWLIRSDQA
jgi:hypothetical protein